MSNTGCHMLQCQPYIAGQRAQLALTCPEISKSAKLQVSVRGSLVCGRGSMSPGGCNRLHCYCIGSFCDSHRDHHVWIYRNRTWMSSLKTRCWFLYRCRRVCAYCSWKSSNCSTVLGHRLITASTNSSKICSHSFLHSITQLRFMCWRTICPGSSVCEQCFFGSTRDEVQCMLVSTSAHCKQANMWAMCL